MGSKQRRIQRRINRTSYFRQVRLTRRAWEALEELRVWHEQDLEIPFSKQDVIEVLLEEELDRIDVMKAAKNS